MPVKRSKKSFSKRKNFRRKNRKSLKKTRRRKMRGGNVTSSVAARATCAVNSLANNDNIFQTTFLEQSSTNSTPHNCHLVNKNLFSCS
jgi:hypothetical protein